jgi:manganese/zinc/iron transport system substrate-binding protein
VLVRFFKYGLVVISALLVVWWLNIPFLDSPKDNAPTVVTSTPILADLTQVLMGPDVNVISLTNRVSNPETQSIANDKRQALSRADLVILNGGPHETVVAALVGQLSGSTKVLNIANLMKKQEKNWPDYYWMSPVHWNRLVHYMQIYLKRAFPKRRSEINYRKMAYTNDVYVMHKTIKEALDEWKMSASGLCSNHESLAPLAKAFGIPFVALELSDNMSEESLNAMVDALKKAKIKKIHPNDAISQSGLDELVKAALSQGWQLQVGPPVFSLNLDQMGSGIENYLEMMMFNLRSITEG